jgi:hypothetical protein
MENPFKHIDKPLQQVPDELKAKVMNDIATAKLLMELAHLFSVDLIKIIEATIKSRKNK